MAQDGRGAGGQPPLNLHLIDAQGQTAHQPFFLLEVQAGQLAVIFLRDTGCLEHIVIQLAGVSAVFISGTLQGTFAHSGSANPVRASWPRPRRWQGRKG